MKWIPGEQEGHWGSIGCPRCGADAKLVRYTMLVARSKKMCIVLHCSKPDCDTEFSLDLFNLGEGTPYPAGLVIEVRPEKITRRHVTMHDMISD